MTDERSLHHGRGYFERQYESSPDPWGFDERWYERRKYDLTLAALPTERFRRGLEPGCANGALTERLAARCDQLIAFDLLPQPVDRARQRLQPVENVRLEVADFPAWWPDGGGDLVVWSEVAYYLTAAGRQTAAHGLEGWLEPGGTLISVHYTEATDYPMQGREVSRWLDTLPFLDRRVALRDVEFELAVWTRRP